MNATHTLLQLTGSRLPVIQAPMAGVQSSRLTIAACEAGALGSLPAALLTPNRLREELDTIRRHTSQPYNVNFFVHRMPTTDAGQHQRWQAALMPFYREFGLSEQDIPPSGGRQPFGQEQADILSEYRVPVVSFHFGLPEPELLAQVRQTGAVIMSSATTVTEARWLEKNGCDIIIAQGLEAGGHRGMFLSRDLSTQLGTFSLLPQIAAAVSIPVIAAGGIANETTAHAARRLGADGIQIGTALLLSDEAETSALHRAALQSNRAEHTALTNLFTGGYARGIVNRFMREAGSIHPDVLPFPLAQAAYTPLRAAAEAQGSSEFSPLWAGENAPLARPGSSTDIIRHLAAAFAA